MSDIWTGKVRISVSPCKILTWWPTGPGLLLNSDILSQYSWTRHSLNINQYKMYMTLSLWHICVSVCCVTAVTVLHHWFTVYGMNSLVLMHYNYKIRLPAIFFLFTVDIYMNALLHVSPLKVSEHITKSPNTSISWDRSINNMYNTNNFFWARKMTNKSWWPIYNTYVLPMTLTC